jgi:iron complex transport system substrate-binding protein
MLEYLDRLNTLVGISGKRYVNNRWVSGQTETGNIVDIGYDQNINYEAIVALKPDLVMTYGVGSEIASYIGKLKDLGIPVLINGDYLEQLPLAKSEWIKVVAALYNLEDQAGLRFDHLVKEYQQIKLLALNVPDKPEVMIGLPWKDTWYIPGANSFAAHFINDAGGSYIWNSKHTNEAVPLSLEAVYEQAKDADIWINPGTAGSLDEIVQIDERLSAFNPVRQNLIYNNNRIVNKYGGNDYWESGIMNPQKILADLIKIFHPEILPDHQLVYYKKLN